MYFGYIVVAIRFIEKNLFVSLVKVFSLALGLACSILVIAHVQYVNSYDKHFDNWQNIYRVVTSLTSAERLHMPLTADPYGDHLRESYQEVENVAKIRPDNAVFSVDGQAEKNSFLWVDDGFLDIFALDFIAGDRATALWEVNSVIISEDTAHKYFGDINPLGRTLTFNGSTDLRVSGIFKNIPSNSHLELDILISSATGRSVNSPEFMSGSHWLSFQNYTYITLRDGSSYSQINDSLPNFIEQNIPEQFSAAAVQIELDISLEPLARIYLSSRESTNSGDASRIKILLALVVFSFLVFVSSCINYLNLAISQMPKRVKEVGVRRTVGASPGQIITEFTAESAVLTVAALILSVGLVLLFFPSYAALVNIDFSIGDLPLFGLTLSVVLLVIFTIGLSGLLPAYFLSRIKVANVFSQGASLPIGSSLRLKSTFTFFQVALAISLVLLAVFMYRLVDHLERLDPGFNPYDLIVIDSAAGEASDLINMEGFINQLRTGPGVVSVATSSVRPPSTGSHNSQWTKLGEVIDESRGLSSFVIDSSYIDTYQLSIIAGRGFTQDNSEDFVPASGPIADSTYGVILTQRGVSRLGLGDNHQAIGEILVYQGTRYRVIGVVGDFRLSGGAEDSLMTTSILIGVNRPLRYISIRIDPLLPTEATEHIDAVWSAYKNNIPIDREFYEQTYNLIIKNETQSLSNAAYFSGVISSVIGLFGLTALTLSSVQRRRKEIAIRKILGGQDLQIFFMLSKKLLLLVALSSLFATAVSFYVVMYVYSGFSSYPSIAPSVFFITAAIALTICALTSYVISKRTMDENSSMTLRSE